MSAELKRYVGFTDEDADRLAAFGPTAAASFERLARELYTRITDHAETRAVIASPAQIGRLHTSFVAWLERVFGGVYDDAYFEKTAWIGKVHVRAGLPQRFVIAAMSGLRISLGAIIDDALVRDALTRLLDIELAVMLEAYRDDASERLERTTRTQQKLRLDAAGTLVAGLAHEIRNPLNNAGLHLAVLARALASRHPDEAIDAARVVGTELDRLSSVVTDFLEFARPMPFTPTRVSLVSLCERAIAKVAIRGVTLLREWPDDPVELDADEARLEQVVVHLLENALHAANNGRVVIRVQKLPPHAWVEVEDDGPGLPSPNAPIFDAFYTTKPEGTGLGLAIVHRVVTDHEGHVEVDSRPGATRFRLRLPLIHQGTAS